MSAAWIGEELLLVDAVPRNDLVLNHAARCAPAAEIDIDLAGHHLVRGRPLGIADLNDDLIDVMRPRAAVIAVPLQHDAIVANEFGRRSRGLSREALLDALRCNRQANRHRAQIWRGHPGGEVGNRLRQPDDQLVPGGPDIGNLLEVLGRR